MRVFLLRSLWKYIKYETDFSFLLSREAQSDSYGQGRFFFSQTHGVCLHVERERALPIFFPSQARPSSLLNIFFFFFFPQFIRPSSLKPVSLILFSFQPEEKEEGKNSKKETCSSETSTTSMFCCIRAKRKINISSSSSSLPLTIQCDRSPVLFGAFSLSLSLCVWGNQTKKEENDILSLSLSLI